MSEVNSFKWTVKINVNNVLCNEEIEFEAGKTLELPCKWRFRFFNPHRQLHMQKGTKCVSLTYELDLELVDCPRDKPSVFAAFEILYFDYMSKEPGRLEMEKRELKKGHSNESLLNVDTLKSELTLKISFTMFNTPSTIQKCQDPNVKEALLLIQNKTKCGILKDNQNLLEQEDSFADFVIRVNDTGKEFPVHKGILASRSPVFRTMFNSGMKEASDGFMEIGDLSTKALEIILKFIYSGNMSKGWTDVVQEMIYAGSKYEMKILTEFCDIMLVYACSSENAIDFLKLSRKFKLKTAEKEIKAWISQNVKYELILNDYELEPMEEAS